MSTQKNILLITFDDLNDWVGCLGGHPQASTPNIDRLAARGTLFANAHCQAPICNPSRVSLFTGLRPSTTGLYALKPGLRDSEATRNTETLTQYFRRHGYFTAAFGKVHHDGSVPDERQNEEFEVWGDINEPLLPPEKLVPTVTDNPWVDWGVFPEDEQDLSDWKTASDAIAQLEARPADRPFFIAAGFRHPHVPCYVPQHWFDQVPDGDDLILPSVRDGEAATLPRMSHYLHWDTPEPDFHWLVETGQWRPLVRAYLACMAFVDSQVGRLLDALDASGEADNTVIFLWADHGWHLGEKELIGKLTLYERSTHVPLIFAGPGIRKNSVCTRPAELLDIYPTLAALCGLPSPKEQEGHSLIPQLQDPNSPRPWPAITTHNQGNHAVKNERWRYIRYADGSEELYDVVADPHEWSNRIGDPTCEAIRAELAAWLPETDAPPAPGSADRILVREGDQWIWEGKPIPEDPSPA